MHGYEFSPLVFLSSVAVVTPLLMRVRPSPMLILAATVKVALATLAQMRLLFTIRLVGRASPIMKAAYNDGREAISNEVDAEVEWLPKVGVVDGRSPRQTSNRNTGGVKSPQADEEFNLRCGWKP